ncbi:ferrous iron transport protein A [Candidatus Bathyarchaeota archaeon]|nr:ferrous iron transport protein A [Candidatus Bathyarchaeota archaeon]
MDKKLSELEPGDTGVVVKIVGSSSTRRRIMDMGVVRGTKVVLIRRAPLGDPVELEIRDYNLSLRKGEADNIYVETEDSIE